jgi:hypothetical protein
MLGRFGVILGLVVLLLALLLSLLALIVYVLLLLVPPARYLVRPLRLRKRLNYAARPEILPIDRDQQHPSGVDEFFKRVDRPLRKLGYELAGDSVNPNFAEHVVASNRVYVNRATLTTAILVISYSKNAKDVWEFKRTTISIRTNFADGFQLVTSNAVGLVARPRRPNMWTIRFVNITDPMALHVIHMAIVERYFASKTRDLDLDSKFKRDATLLTQSFASQEFEHMVRTGYFYHDEVEDKLRLTLRGAYLTVWKNSWPWRQWRHRRRDREAARVLRKIGLNEQGRPRTPPARNYPSEVVRTRANGVIPPDFRDGPRDGS